MLTHRINVISTFGLEQHESTRPRLLTITYLISFCHISDFISCCWVVRRKGFATDRIHPFIVDKYLWNTNKISNKVGLTIHLPLVFNIRKKINKENQKKPLTVADLGGVPGTRPLRTKISLISWGFSKNVLIYWVGVPQGVGAPSYDKSWIRPCLKNFGYVHKREENKIQTLTKNT